MTLATGTRLGPFEVVAPLGTGGMGEVYRARDVRLGREVALKVLPAGFASDREKLIRFAHEARSASALSHPNIVAIFEVGQAGSYPFIAMELIDGRTLRAVVDEGPIPFRKTVTIGFQIADGLAKAHAAGIVHRDLKPENVMITRDGYVKILDFGLAKLVGADGLSAGPPSMTATGFVLGTAGYMSPEQASGKAVDFRSDQFSLGLILYEMATGRRAFTRSTAVQTLSAIIQDEAEPIESINPKIPAPFRWIVSRCLAKDPEDRYASTRDLARDLENQKDVGAASIEAAGSAAGAPAAAGPTERFPKEAVPVPAPARARRAASFAAWLAAAVLLFAAGAGTGFWVRGAASDPPEPRWRGDLLLGGSVRVFAPRISPDGQTLAFITPDAGVAQVALMKPGTGDWVILTHEKSRGPVQRMDWSRDGSRIVFDRVGDASRAVFSIPVLGGEERLLLDDAQGPEYLPDGSLLVVRIDRDDHFRLARFWPDTARIAPVGPPLLRDASGASCRAFAGGREAIFYGRLAGSGPAPRQAWVIDLASGRARRFAPGLPLSPPVTIAADGRSVIADLVTADLHRLIRIPPGEGAPRTLLTLPARPWYVNEAPDGSLFVEFIDDPLEVLRFPPAGGVPERLASTGRNIFMAPLQLPDGRVLIPEQASGRRKLLAAAPGEAPRAFVETAEQASPPVALAGDLVAFVGGGFTSRSPPILTLATAADGRIARRLEATKGIVCSALAGSSDGRTLYYVDSGWLWSVPVAGGVPRRLRSASGVAVDPSGGDLVVQLNERGGVRLVRWAPGGSDDRPIPLPADLRPSPAPIAANAISADGRLLVSAPRGESGFVGPAIVDLATGAVTRVPVQFEGDVFPSSWGRDGSIVGMGAVVKTDLWRFLPQ